MRAWQRFLGVGMLLAGLPASAGTPLEWDKALADNTDVLIKAGMPEKAIEICRSVTQARPASWRPSFQMESAWQRSGTEIESKHWSR